jgi:hypothetical protein
MRAKRRAISSLQIDSKCSQAIVSAERFVLNPQKLRAEAVVGRAAAVKSAAESMLSDNA